jgi:hypothetical protein
MEVLKINEPLSTIVLNFGTWLGSVISHPEIDLHGEVHVGTYEGALKSSLPNNKKTNL